jgi:hypothetical protein
MRTASPRARRLFKRSPLGKGRVPRRDPDLTDPEAAARHYEAHDKPAMAAAIRAIAKLNERL